MKEDRVAQKPFSRPAYNVQIGTEGQFIVGYSLYQHAGDTSCFINHMEHQNFPEDRQPEKVSGDAAYGSEENYVWLGKKQFKNFLKYNTFLKEQRPPRKPELVEKARFLAANFPYDSAKDEFTCPAGHPMTYLEAKPYRISTGYLSERCFYECTQGTVCPLKPNAQKPRTTVVSRSVLNSNVFANKPVRTCFPSRASHSVKKRSIKPETVFGDIKQNRSFRRFLLWGLKKVEIEWGILFIVHNLRKLAAQ